MPDPSARSLADQATAGQKRAASSFATAALFVGLAALAACGPSVDPIERARVTAGRAPTTTLPSVPGEDQPYPSLGSVPPRPETTPPAERQALADRLVADRTNARYVGQPVVPTQRIVQPAPQAAPVEAAPLAQPSSGLLGAEDTPGEPLGVARPVGAPPTPEPPPIAGAPPIAPAAAATEAVAPEPRTTMLAAATPQPAPPSPSPSPAAPISVEPLAPPPPPAMPEELPARARTAEPPASVPPAPVLLPVETASPAPPPIVSAPLATPAPPPTPPAPAPVSAPVPVPVSPPPPQPVQPSVVIDRTALQPGRARVAQPGYALSFLPGTTTIVASDRAVLASLASRGAGATFRVTGFADEAGTGRALDLPLARARAVADALRAAGVSAEAIELGGAARPGPAGRGAEVTLITAR